MEGFIRVAKDFCLEGGRGGALREGVSGVSGGEGSSSLVEGSGLETLGSFVEAALGGGGGRGATCMVVMVKLWAVDEVFSAGLISSQLRLMLQASNGYILLLYFLLGQS